MQYLIYFYLFIFGLAFGSFLNVVSLRYKPEQKLFSLKIIGGRSHCLACRKQLVWYELVPIFSFLFQKGKCRHCGHRISLQYPLVEFLAAVIFIAVPFLLSAGQWSMVSGQWLRIIIWIAIFLLFLLLAIIDFRHYIIPDEINILLAVLGIMMIVSPVGSQMLKVNDQMSFIGYYSMLFGSFGNIWVNHIGGAILPMVFFGLIIILSRGRGMGVGDFKLAGALGLIFGWPDILLVLALSFIVGAFVSVFLMIRKKKNIKDAVPFGPFLVIGAALVFFFGFQIVNLYFGFFGLIM